MKKKLIFGKIKKNENTIDKNLNTSSQKKTNLTINQTEINQKEIKIDEKLLSATEETKVFGVYDPADYNFDLNMWSNTSADDVRSSLKRIKKIELSRDLQ